jgi:hypothetical protein
MSDATVVGGSCLCGEVQFEVRLPTKWCAHCHCSLCRRAHGAAFVTWFGVERSAFEVIGGLAALVWYRSSDKARRGFCSTCGSTLFFESERWPDEMHVALALMHGAIDREPAAHVFFDSHVSWFEPQDELRRLGGPSGTEEVEQG